MTPLLAVLLGVLYVGIGLVVSSALDTFSYYMDGTLMTHKDWMWAILLWPLWVLAFLLITLALLVIAALDRL